MNRQELEQDIETTEKALAASKGQDETVKRIGALISLQKSLIGELKAELKVVDIKRYGRGKKVA